MKNRKNDGRGACGKREESMVDERCGKEKGLSVEKESQRGRRSEGKKREGRAKKEEGDTNNKEYITAENGRGGESYKRKDQKMR